MLENVNRDLRLLGITAFLIAPLVYAASSLWDELDLAIAESKAAQRKAEEQSKQAEEEVTTAQAHQREVEAKERSFQQEMALEQQPGLFSPRGLRLSATGHDS